MDLMELALRDLKSASSIFEYQKYLTIYRDMLKVSERTEKLAQVEEQIRLCDEEIKKLAERRKGRQPSAQ
jgi:hypothetical protein